MDHVIRGSDVFLKEDIRTILQALLLTNMAAQADKDTQYSRGFAVAIASIATAFNITLDVRRMGGL